MIDEFIGHWWSVRPLEVGTGAGSPQPSEQVVGSPGNQAFYGGVIWWLSQCDFININSGGCVERGMPSFFVVLDLLKLQNLTKDALNTLAT